MEDVKVIFFLKSKYGVGNFTSQKIQSALGFNSRKSPYVTLPTDMEKLLGALKPLLMGNELKAQEKLFYTFKDITKTYKDQKVVVKQIKKNDKKNF